MSEVARADRLFEAFYSEHAQSIVKFAYLMVGCDSAAQDLAQEAFIAVYSRFDQLDNPVAYLRTCIVNGAKRHRRRAQQGRDILPRLGSRIVTRDHPDELRDILARLPERQRAAIFLKFYLDLKDRDIALVLRCRPGTVKSTLHAARQRLAEVLG